MAIPWSLEGFFPRHRAPFLAAGAQSYVLWGITATALLPLTTHTHASRNTSRRRHLVALPLVPAAFMPGEWCAWRAIIEHASLMHCRAERTPALVASGGARHARFDHKEHSHERAWREERPGIASRLHSCKSALPRRPSGLEAERRGYFWARHRQRGTARRRLGRRKPKDVMYGH